MESHLLDDCSLTLPEKILTFSYEFPALWTLVIHLELVENRERIAISFTIKSSFWCTTLDDVINEIIWCSIFFLSKADALYCIFICETCSAIALAVSFIFIRLWCLALLTFRNFLTIMLASFSMLIPHYYAQNYAGIMWTTLSPDEYVSNARDRKIN